ncbi:MAG: TRAP transporter substrate-binding protein DctP [Deltaproteobacteria bacterium]|nr:TRAP transporter substrate-binding protein DctP [Deltaproteobacteria bacterium]
MKKRNIIMLTAFLSVIFFFFVVMPSTAAEKIVWRGQSSYSAGLPQLYAPSEHFAKEVERLTDGRLVIKMSPGGAIVPAMKVFDAVSAGTLDIGCTWAGWWIGKFPAAVLFANSYPNGLQMQEMLGWIYAGGGLELWNELYKDHNIVVLPPYGMLGSENFCWSRKPINKLSDFKGLKFRTVGIWGQCLERLGARVVTLPGAEVYPALERGVIDACEFGTPAIDKKFGFQEICSYLKLPGIHEPCAPLETLVNKKSWEKLPDDLKYKVQVALRDTCFWAINQALKEDAEAMEFFRSYEGLHVSKLTPEMIDEIVKVGDTLLEEHAQKDPMFKKVLESQIAFRKKVEPYADLIRLPYPYAR